MTERPKSSHETASANDRSSSSSTMQIKMPDVASCLVLDIRLPGVSGLDFQAKLAAADILIPIIFMTGHGDIPMSVKR